MMRRWLCAWGLFLVATAALAEGMVLWRDSFDSPGLVGKGVYGSADGTLRWEMEGVTNWTLDVSAALMDGEGSYAVVTNGCLEICRSGGPVLWCSRKIWIGGVARVGIEVDISEVGSMEGSDWMELAYRLDDFTNWIVRAIGTFGATTLTVDDLSGSALEVVVYACNSALDERHRLEEVRVVVQDPGPPPAPVIGLLPARSSICVAAGLLLSFAVEASVGRDEWVTLRAQELPSGASCPAASGLERVETQFAWRPEVPGRSRVQFVAEGSSGMSTSELAVCVHRKDRIWINELHYDNAGTDVGEGVELGGVRGLALGELVLDACNGINGLVIAAQRTPLVGVLGGGHAEMGVHWQPMAGLQNGPDGVVLWGGMCLATCVWDVVGYEGSFVVLNGPAAGVVAESIGVREDGDTPEGFSLQKTGAGWGRDGFGWTRPSPASPGEVNAAQRVFHRASVFSIR